MSSTRTPHGAYSYSQGASTTNPSPNITNREGYSIPSYLYVERRSVNPVPITQPNQPQYVESDRSKIGFDSARTLQAQSSSMYNRTVAPAAPKNVNLTSKINSPAPSQLQYSTYGKESLFAKKELRPEIDDSPIVDPSSFYYLNLGDKNAAKGGLRPSNDSGIDTRPIVNIDAVTQLERRRQQQIQKNQRTRGDDELDSGVDARPITNLDAFKFLEKRDAEKTKNNKDELVVDTRPIINPNAFKYLEQRNGSSSDKADESGVDSKPRVNPDAFRYLEQRKKPVQENIESGIDTTARVNPQAFQWIERKETPKQIDNGPDVDIRSYVNLKAFSRIERPVDVQQTNKIESGVDQRSYVNPTSYRYLEKLSTEPKHNEASSTNDSAIDTKSYVNPNAFRHLELRETIPKGSMINSNEGGVDQRSYVNPASYRYLEKLSNEQKRPELSPTNDSTIDTKSYVSPNAFRHLEMRDIIPQSVSNNTAAGGVDQRSYVSPNAFRHLESTEIRPLQTELKNLTTYGQTDF